MSKNKIIIFGAGPSGLSTAYGVKKNSPQDIEMFEKKSSVGGLAGSFIMDKDFIDYGPHRLAIQNLKIKQIAESFFAKNIFGETFFTEKFSDKIFFAENTFAENKIANFF